jgi:hypothetical protein
MGGGDADLPGLEFEDETGRTGNLQPLKWLLPVVPPDRPDPSKRRLGDLFDERPATPFFPQRRGWKFA